MSSARKRKLATYEQPSENEINNSILMHAESKQSKIYNPEREEKNGDFLDCEVFSDSVHGHFELPRLLLKIIDTPQFQRLRFIHQMGFGFFLFTGACHNRFQHCIGVAYLAGRLCKVLQKHQPELGITSQDILCLQIAGLCHDIGHGPYSHFFDNVLLPLLKPGTKWSHEQGSIDMFTHMVEENDLESVFLSNGLSLQDIVFIKELIHHCSNDQDSLQEWPYKGRPKEKSFLYEIVSNKTSGNDVDKWDYLARDCHHLGIPNGFNYRRFLKFARVIMVDGQLHICTRDKEVGTLYEMFHMRNLLGTRSYQHKTSLILDLMFGKVFYLAHDHIHIPGKHGKMLKIAECVDDMHAFTKLTDNMLMLIEVSNDENLKESQELLKRIYTRDLYKLVGKTILKTQLDKSEDELRHDILSNIDCDMDEKEDFIVKKIKFNYGMQDKNPMDCMRFYDKNNPNVAFKIEKCEVSHILPDVFNELHVRLICTKNDPFLIQHAASAFKLWCESINHVPELDESTSASSECSSVVIDTEFPSK